MYAFLALSIALSQAAAYVVYYLDSLLSEFFLWCSETVLYYTCIYKYMDLL